MRKATWGLTSLVCVILAAPSEAPATPPDTLVQASSEFAETLTGVPGSRAMVDRDGNVAALGIPAPELRPAGKKSKFDTVMCGVSEAAPNSGDGQGFSVWQDAYLKNSADNWYYIVFGIPGKPGKNVRVKTTWRLTGPSGEFKKREKNKLERGFFWSVGVQFDKLSERGLHRLAVSIRKGGDCETVVDVR